MLIDTGADLSALHPYDWTTIVPLDRWFDWRDRHPVGGISGQRYYSTEPAVIVFRDTSDRRFVSAQEAVDIAHIITPGDVSTQIPALLGMDIISEGSLILNAHDDKVVLDVPGEYLE